MNYETIIEDGDRVATIGTINSADGDDINVTVVIIHHGGQFALATEDGANERNWQATPPDRIFTSQDQAEQFASTWINQR